MGKVLYIFREGSVRVCNCSIVQLNVYSNGAIGSLRSHRHQGTGVGEGKGREGRGGGGVFRGDSHLEGTFHTLHLAFIALKQCRCNAHVSRLPATICIYICIFPQA